MAESKVRLKRLAIKAYRSCKSTVFEPNDGLSVLIGRNGSGKTNVMLGINLLTRKMSDGNDSRGHLQRTIIESEFAVGDSTARVTESLRYTTNERNIDIVQYSKERWRFKINGRSSEWKGFVESDNGVATRRSRKTMPDIPTKSQILIIDEILNFCRNTRYYSASEFSDPSKCPPAFEVEQTKESQFPLGDDSAHARFMYDLFRTRETKPKEYEAFVDLVGKHGIGLVDSIDWKKVRTSSMNFEVGSGARVTRKRLNRLLVIPQVSVGQSRLSFNQLSEGTFRTLALLFYLKASSARLLLIEEPEVGIHHGLLNKVIEIVQSEASRKQIICSTHSDFVLDALQPDEVFVVTNTSRQGTLVDQVTHHLSKRRFEALKSYLEAEGSLGDYWRHGGLDP